MNNLLFTRPWTAGALIAAALLAFSASAQSQEYFASQTASDTDELRVAELSILSGEASVAFSRQIQQIEQIRRNLRTGDGFMRDVDEITLNLILDPKNARSTLAQEYSEHYGSKIAPTAPVLEQVDRAIEALWNDATQFASAYPSLTGKPVSEALNEALAEKLRAAVPHATYVTARMTGSEWTIEKNALGVPVAKSIDAAIFYRLPGNPFVVCREVTIRRSYFQKPAQGDPGEVEFGDVRLQGRVD